jgi:ABC-type spermidine/putrescine transport system permease subunit II
MAAPTLTSAFFRRISRLGSTQASSKGELLASVSSIWFLIFLLTPVLIVVFFGFTTVNSDLTISYSQLTGDNYLEALAPFGAVATLFVRTIIVAFLAAVGSLVIAFPISYYLARVCREENRGILVSLFVIPFWISFVVQVYAVLPWVRRDGYIGMVLDRIGLGAVANWVFGSLGYGTPGIVVPVLIYIWLPFMILPLFTAILRIDPALIEASQDLGAGSWKTMWNVVFPLSYNGILTGTILVFITAFGSFVEPKVLAGSNGLLLGNYIQSSFLELGRLPQGAAASVVVLVPTIALLYVYVTYAQAPATGLARESVVARLLRAAWGRLSPLLDRLSTKLRRVSAHPVLAVANPKPTTRVPRNRFERLFDTVASWKGPGILRAYTFLALAAFYIPLVQVVIFSFNHDSNTIVWSYPSLQWYFTQAGSPNYQQISSLFSDTAMTTALYNSIVIGLAVTAISLAIGLPAALAIVRYRFSSKPFLNLMLYTGLMIPSIILGLSLLVFVRLVDDLYLWPYLGATWDFGYASIIVGHVTFCIPIVIVVLIVSLREFDRSIEEAAMNLGANEITTFFRVTIPNIMPGIVSAALLAFTFSFSEVVVTLFLTGAGIQTLPILFWAKLSKQIPTPELNAASTLIIGLSIVFVLLANKVQRGGTLFRF